MVRQIEPRRVDLLIKDYHSFLSANPQARAYVFPKSARGKRQSDDVRHAFPHAETLSTEHALEYLTDKQRAGLVVKRMDGEKVRWL